MQQLELVGGIARQERSSMRRQAAAAFLACSSVTPHMAWHSASSSAARAAMAGAWRGLVPDATPVVVSLPFLRVRRLVRLFMQECKVRPAWCLHSAQDAAGY